jgi:hypothetical protein
MAMSKLPNDQLTLLRHHSVIPSKDLDVQEVRVTDKLMVNVPSSEKKEHMMKLSTMLKVDSTVDTQWQSQIAERILEQWEHDQGSAQFFRSSTGRI